MIAIGNVDRLWRLMGRDVATALLSLCAISMAFAQSVPRDHHEQVSLTFDRSSAPEQWLFRSQLAAHYTAGNGRASRTAFVCRSSTDPASGACSVTPANVTGPVPTPVSLRFTEARSKLQVDLNVSATKVTTVAGSGCTHVLTAFHSSRNYGRCTLGPYDVSRYTLSISRTELQKIPVGGLWRGRLAFDVREYQNPVRSAVHSYDIELRVTDRQNAQIYFPTLSNTSPRVAMDLRSRPGPGFGTTLYGGRTVDMCFYDGFGSNSTGALRVRATDVGHVGGGVPGRIGYGTLVARNTNGLLPQHRIEYRLHFGYGSAREWLRIGEAAAGAFPPVSQAPIRIVRLPGIPTPVACAPATLTFEVVPFESRSKVAGGYDGRIRIEMYVDAALI